ncbi:MAG TPA: hypothetical protein VM681_01635 [Candidatus Thermoplasmatota archaeon]|nr:hypothetical protein [Candidatus Thermoplasmatota archaeon]
MSEMTNAVLVIQAVIATNLILIALAFANDARAQRSASRLNAGHSLFRITMAAIITGIAVASIADAIRYTADLSRDSPIFLQPTILGVVLIAVGLTGIASIVSSSRFDRAAGGT